MTVPLFERCGFASIDEIKNNEFNLYFRDLERYQAHFLKY